MKTTEKFDAVYMKRAHNVVGETKVTADAWNRFYTFVCLLCRSDSIDGRGRPQPTRSGIIHLHSKIFSLSSQIPGEGEGVPTARGWCRSPFRFRISQHYNHYLMCGNGLSNTITPSYNRSACIQTLEFHGTSTAGITPQYNSFDTP